ncbi:carbohydrate-binding family 9-like protein [Acidobacteria bacterium AH-259-O06]|nr:carbohydrate-binding family 9-like protein [Acidobacteria bacterium AH-259-O06]
MSLFRVNHRFQIPLLMAFPILTTAAALCEHTYKCWRVDSPITVDGKFDEPVWKQAPWTELKENDSGDQPLMQGKFAMLWDSRYLYLAYDLVDRNILSTIDHRDALLWIQDVAEIFIDPLQSEQIYYEFQFNPRDNFRDLVVMHRGTGSDIYPLGEWASATLVKAIVTGTLDDNQDNDRGWTLEVAIPFSDLWLAPHIPPREGDRWRMNVFRIDYGLKEPELSAWNPTRGPSFHIPTKFGTLLFKQRSNTK